MSAAAIGKHIETLKQHIQHTAQQLEQQSDLSSEDGMGSLIYLGNHHDAVPRDLVLDPILESGEIHTWMLMKIHVDNPMLPTRIPSQDMLMNQLKCSRPIVSRHMQVLRALRWLTLCAEVRGRDGQYRGVVYTQHDHPLSLADTLYLDPGYIDFLEQPTKGDVLKRLRIIKDSVLTHTDYVVFLGQQCLHSPPTYLEQIDARLRSQTSGDPLDTHLSCPASMIPPDGVLNLYGEPEKFAQAEHLNHHVKNFDMVKSIEAHQSDHVKNIDTAETVEITGVDEISDKSPCKKLLHGDLDAGGVRGGSSSLLNNNNKNKKTTTTTTENQQSLNFPKAVSKSARQIAYALKQLEPLPESKRQFALNYLADRVKAGEKGTDAPVGNAIRYLAWIVKSILAGTLPESDYGQRGEPRCPEIPDSIQQSREPLSKEDRKEKQRHWAAVMEKLGRTQTVNSD